MQVLCLRVEDAMKPTAIDQSASPLLALPAELRNAIWSLLLIQKEHACRTSTASPQRDAPEGQKRRFCANVLRACKQVNFEATPILYGENTFTAHPSLLATLPSLVLARRPNRLLCPPVTSQRVAKMIRRYHVHVRLDTDPRFTKTQVGESFSGAEELEVEVFQAMYGSCDFSVLRLFEGVRGVGRAVVYGSVGDGKYAAWLASAMMSPPGSCAGEYSETCIGGDRSWHAWTHGNR